MTRRAIYLFTIGMCLTVTAAMSQQVPPPQAMSFPDRGFVLAGGTSKPASGMFKRALNMKLLVLSADGTEPSFTAITFFLDHLGIPYDAVVLTKTQLPPLNDGIQGFYQGIVLATGNLSFSDGASWAPALNAEGWASLDAYQRDYGVRAVSYFTYPEARYGLAPAGTGVSYTSAAPGKLAVTKGGSTLFPYLMPGNRLSVVYAYHYPADAVAATGETTTPIMTITAPGGEETTAGVTHVASDGRESLAMTVDAHLRSSRAERARQNASFRCSRTFAKKRLTISV